MGNPLPGSVSISSYRMSGMIKKCLKLGTYPRILPLSQLDREAVGVSDLGSL